MWVARELDYEILEMIKAFPNLETIQEPGIYIKILPKEFPNNYVYIKISGLEFLQMARRMLYTISL